jgi:hypothetical protein
MAGHYTNGSGRKQDDDEEPSNVASLDEARRKAKERAKASARLDRVPSTMRDRVIGGIFILMALGMITYWGAGLLKVMK